MSSEDPVADFLAREQNEMAGMEDEFNDVNGHDTNHIDHDDGMVNGDIGAATTMGVMNGRHDMQPSPQPQANREEPATIRKWREEQKKRLDKKDADEAKKKEEWLSNGKKELSDWHKKRAEQLDKTKKNNRSAEAAFVKERDAELPGQKWEKITRLCEFNPKASKSTKDVSRMRGMLLQMKAGETTK